MVWEIEITALTRPTGIRVAGEVDMATQPVWEVALDVMCGAPDDTVVDMAGLTFIDVGGLRALARAALSLRSRGRRVSLYGVRPAIRRLIDVLGWTELFTFPHIGPGPDIRGTGAGRIHRLPSATDAVALR
nr:STAS domain-containing protein [uncultured Actinoplanes sp.]